MMLLQVSTQVASLQELLNNLYDEMLPLCSDMINVGRALGGLGALFFIAIRVWRHQAEASAIEFFPLLRPFAIGLAISLFPQMLGALNGVLGGLSNATASIVLVQNQDIIRLQERKTELLKAKPENAAYEDDALFEKELENKDVLDFGGKAALYFDRMSYSVQKNFREWIRNVLELAYQSAALVINTIRTFFLIILSIVGPLSFGFAIWPGFEGTLSNWFSRYVNVFMWLPVANIFGAIVAKIQVLMLNRDITQIQSGMEMDKADMGYMIFLVIAIAGYFTVPSVASWIVSASGLTNITRFANTQGGSAASMAGAAAGGAAGQVVGRAMSAGKQIFGGGGQPSGGGQGGNGFQNTNKAA